VTYAERVREAFDLIPALAELRGGARIRAEEVIDNIIADAIEDYVAGCEPVADMGEAA